MNIIYRCWMTLKTDDDDDDEELFFLWSCTDVSTTLWTLWFSLCQMCVLHISIGKYYSMHCLKICAYKMSWKLYKNVIKKKVICFFPSKTSRIIFFCHTQIYFLSFLSLSLIHIIVKNIIIIYIIIIYRNYNNNNIYIYIYIYIYIFIMHYIIMYYI